MTMFQRALTAAFVAVFALSATGCGSSSRKKDGMPELSQREMRMQAGELYKLARESLDASDFQAAIDRYTQLSLRFPFTEYATQGELEKIYALYRSYDPDRATSAADRFLREHPRHPAVDYVQYLKGLINETRDQSLNEILSLGDSASKGDVSSEQRAFDEYSLLVQKYPNSKYVGDARLRMIALRNRIAEHELHVVRFYVSRGAYLAAAKRAEQIIAQYPGAPATYEALSMLETCYRQAGLTQQAEDARRLLAAQPPRQVANATHSDDGWFRRLFGERSAAPKEDPAARTPEAGATGGLSLGGSRLNVTMEPYDSAPPATAPASAPAGAETLPSTAPGDPNATTPPATAP